MAVSIVSYVGTTLYSKSNVTKYIADTYSGGFITKMKPAGVFYPGQEIGRVYSFVKNPRLMFMYYPGGDTTKTPYFTEAIPAFYDIPDKVQVAIIKDKAEQEALIKDAKGNFAFYFDKYAPKVFLAIGALYLLNSYIKKSN